MAIEYLGLSEINGPLVAVEGVRGAFYDEIVELVVEGKQKKLGRIVEINNDYAVVQVFESTVSPPAMLCGACCTEFIRLYPA